MNANCFLHDYLSNAAGLHPDAIALREISGNTITYSELKSLADRVASYLKKSGVKRGDRVGVCLGKSIDTVAVIFGILRVGAAYVPVDPGSPASRNAQIFLDCQISALVLESKVAAPLNAAIAEESSTQSLNTECPAAFHQLVIEGVGGGVPLNRALDAQFSGTSLEPVEDPDASPDDLAYILFTSGSTGRPKGVMLTHRNAISFIDWCTEVFCPSQLDCFSSHAPFHFDLSILDLYLSIKHAARLVLIDDTTGKSPGLLTELIAREKITLWYSTPSVLTLMVQYGKLEQHDCSSLRLILFAGEVFPVKYLRALQERLPRPRYFNLYGPTETNVCTYFEVPSHVPEDRKDAYPIGQACSHLRTKVIDDQGQSLGQGLEGELCVSGPAVSQGYWNRLQLTASSFLTDPAGEKWYKTGDIVSQLSSGDYQFLGRRDRMIKRRGHRVELGEIEAALIRHPAVREVAVVVRTKPDGDNALIAVLACESSNKPSIIALKKFCSLHLPASMMPDLYEFLQTLPKTSTDKVDYQKLEKPVEIAVESRQS